jgi:hypothetical protein
VLNLWDLDYYPGVGDAVVYLGRQYQVTKVYLQPSQHFGMTGLPLWVTAEASILRYGDAVPPASLITDGMTDPLALPLMNRINAFQNHVQA